MVECPVCGGASQPTQIACGVCGLPVALFEEFHDVAETPESPTPGFAPNPSASAIGGESPAPQKPETGTSVDQLQPDLHRESRSEVPEATVDPETEGPLGASPVPSEEAIRVAHSLGVNVAALEATLSEALSKGISTQVKRARRELIRAVLDGLIDRYRDLCSRRDAMSSVVHTTGLDAELVAFRKALSGGELTSAEEHRLNAQRAVGSIEVSWDQIRNEVTEAGQMMQALREMGGVAPAVLRPVAEAIRIPRKGEAEEIERRLRKANSLLWGLLVPRMDYEISKGRMLLKEVKASAARTNLIRREIDRMAEEIRRQKIADALESRRFIRAELASVAPKAARAAIRRSFIE